MNPTQLRKLGLSDQHLPTAITACQKAATAGQRHAEIKTKLREVIETPASYQHDPIFGDVAVSLLTEANPTPRQAISYRTWGTDIDPLSHEQMRQACELPMARGAALMPDAHVGYGLPIGGVLALENAVCPYGVGVDIACRMKLTVLDLPIDWLEQQRHRLKESLENCTRFGIGVEHRHPQDHPVLDQDWSITRITREHKDKARRQLGTSGSGNHFVEFGLLVVDARDDQLGLDPGRYLSLLSHSGSRGVGAAVCDTYSRMAQAQLSAKDKGFGRLAWLNLDSQSGQEYWQAMNLMGDYAAANHDVIHRLIRKYLGAHQIAGVENHHNFAWKETHDGRELIVHRKGATPAGAGVLGVIPGSMATPAFVVRGKGHPESLHSAAHGAGRCMSRTKAKEQFNFRAVQKDLLAKGIDVISAGADEVPSVYKNIHQVMAAQQDLVETIARFEPLIVKMSADGRAED